MTRSAALCPLLLLFTACGDDVAGVPEPSAACTITERALLAAPPEGWSVQQYGDYDLYVVDDMILYSFDERADPARQFHRLDRCSGESTPFPSFRPGMQGPFIHATAAGRVLYATKDKDYYVVDRVDEPGDDEPRKIAGLPQPGFLDFNLWAAQTRPYAFFQRGDAVYTHAGDPREAALQVAGNVAQAEPFMDAILVIERSGDVRIVDPYTGAGEVVLTGSQRTFPLDHGATIFDPGATIEDARVLWQPLGADELRIRRIGDGQDLSLTMDPGLLATGDVDWWPGNDGFIVLSDREARQIRGVVDSATGATIEVPPHIDYDLIGDFLPGLSLTLADGDTVVEAIWEPKTGALREWYRGPAPAYSLQAADATHADYYVAEQEDPQVGSLWRVDLASGERRVLVPRTSPWSSPVTEDTTLVEFDVGPQAGVGPLLHLRDLEYVEVDAGRTTPIAEAVAAARALPGEGVIWLDMHGAAPGLWVAPPP